MRFLLFFLKTLTVYLYYFDIILIGSLCKCVKFVFLCICMTSQLGKDTNINNIKPKMKKQWLQITLLLYLHITLIQVVFTKYGYLSCEMRSAIQKILKSLKSPLYINSLFPVSEKSFSRFVFLQ